MRRHLLMICTVLVIAWLAFGWWQYRSYVQQRNLIEESLHQQSHSIMTALIGGIGSHRRIGWYFEEQLQAMLDELTQSPDVIGVTIYSADERPILAAGETAVPQETRRRVNRSLPRAKHPFRTVETFELKPLAAGPGGGGGGGGGGLAADADSVRDDGKASPMMRARLRRVGNSVPSWYWTARGPTC